MANNQHIFSNSYLMHKITMIKPFLLQHVFFNGIAFVSMV